MAVAADSDDAVSNAVVTPEASLFIREILKSAIEHEAQKKPPPDWLARAYALLANVMMNDLLNWWDPKVDPKEAQDHVEEAKKLNPNGSVLALVHHAQGLIHRANKKNGDALTVFQNAKRCDSGFARAHAQIGNQMVICGNDTSAARGFVRDAIDLNDHHPARGYFYWTMGRSYVKDENWRAATRWLRRSVKALPTVWYNRCFLAYAQHCAGKEDDAIETMQSFRAELPSPNELLQHAVDRLPKDIGDVLRSL